MNNRVCVVSLVLAVGALQSACDRVVSPYISTIRIPVLEECEKYFERKLSEEKEKFGWKYRYQNFSQYLLSHPELRGFYEIRVSQSLLEQASLALGNIGIGCQPNVEAEISRGPLVWKKLELKLQDLDEQGIEKFYVSFKKNAIYVYYNSKKK